MKEPKEMALLAAKALSDKKGREIQVCCCTRPLPGANAGRTEQPGADATPPRSRHGTLQKRRVSG